MIAFIYTKTSSQLFPEDVIDIEDAVERLFGPDALRKICAETSDILIYVDVADCARVAARDYSQHAMEYLGQPDAKTIEEINSSCADLTEPMCVIGTKKGL